jgi:hypothetical protein
MQSLAISNRIRSYRENYVVDIVANVAQREIKIEHSIASIPAVKRTKSLPRFWIKASTHSAFQTRAVCLAIASDGPTHTTVPTPK